MWTATSIAARPTPPPALWISTVSSRDKLLCAGREVVAAEQADGDVVEQHRLERELRAIVPGGVRGEDRLVHCAAASKSMFSVNATSMMRSTPPPGRLPDRRRRVGLIQGKAAALLGSSEPSGCSIPADDSGATFNATDRRRQSGLERTLGSETQEDPRCPRVRIRSRRVLGSAAMSALPRLSARLLLPVAPERPASGQ